MHRPLLFVFFAAFLSAATLPQITFSQVQSGVASYEVTRASSAAKINSISRIKELERRAFELLNLRRRAEGASPLEWSEELASVARDHSRSMAEKQFFSHRGADGSMVDDRADRAGIGEWRAIGENIAFNKGYENPIEFAIERWMKSETHRRNLLNESWQVSAVGVAVTDDGAYYFTQIFLLRK